MTKKYDIEYKKQLVHAYMQGTSYPQLEKEYAKEIHNLSKKIAELEKENLFLKKAAAFFAKGID